MKFSNTRVMNIESALRGMRNAKNSWSRSDSEYGLAYLGNKEALERVSVTYENERCAKISNERKYAMREHEGKNIREWLVRNGSLREYKGFIEYAYIGRNDLELAQRLILAGSEHRKFMRQIQVSVDIEAPEYWYKEFDTYKVGTVANSTSTMHKLVATPITKELFEAGNCKDEEIEDIWESLINELERLRQRYVETGEKVYWKELIRLLPNSWKYMRTITMNYENLIGMCSRGQRRNHKLSEWSEEFIKWARGLPYAQELIFIDEVVK